MNRNKISRASVTGAASALIFTMSFAGPLFAADVHTAPATQANTQASHTGSKPAKLDADRDEQRIKALHDQLKITADQESLWNDVAKTMKRNDEKIDTLAKERHDKSATMNAVEDLRSYGDITEAHAADIKTFVPVFERLYERMSTEQKANADEIFRTGGRKTLKSAS